jgi:RNA recognition motif-containing protein
LAYATSWQDLKDYFKGYGRVVRAEALTSADGIPKGQGTVLFETKEDAQNAIGKFFSFDFHFFASHTHAYACSHCSFSTARANNTELQGRVIVVQEDKYVQ